MGRTRETQEGPTHPRGLRRGPEPPRGQAALRPSRDFGALDLERLWAGREKVTQVEREVLREALREAPSGRWLEIGPGGGRLTPVLISGSPSVVVLDLTPGFLRALPRSISDPVARVAGDVLRLPFGDRTFSAVSMVRVYGFLRDPSSALREIARVLVPDGLLVLSYEPKPTLQSLVDDLKMALSRGPGEKVRPRTFSRAPVSEVHPSIYPAWAPTRARFVQVLGSSGFDLREEGPTGLEDYRFLRKLPTGMFVGLSHALSHMGGFPSRFIVARRSPRTWRTPAP